MRPAAAEIVRQRLLDLGHARALVVCEQRNGSNDHPVEAIAALCRLLVDECLLHRRRLLRAAETLERDDFSLPYSRELCLTGEHRLVIQKHHASAALTKAAAEAWPAQLQILA